MKVIARDAKTDKETKRPKQQMDKEEETCLKRRKRIQTKEL